jgi:hypothetical protein
MGAGLLPSGFVHSNVLQLSALKVRYQQWEFCTCRLTHLTYRRQRFCMGPF